MKTVDITGQRFGRLTVTKKLRFRDTAGYIWACRCDCGKEHSASLGNLKSGDVRSCGCLRREMASARMSLRNKVWLEKVGINPHIENTVAKDFRIRLSWYKRNASKRGVKFTLGPKEFMTLLSGPCFYCGLEVSMGIDRINSKEGYIEGNVQWLHKIVNIMKWNLSQDEFINWCRLVCQNN